MKGVKGEIDQRPKRFYREVSTAAADGGWDILLDGRCVRTPANNALRLPTPALAQVIADEWAGQDERIDLAGMSNTRLANVAIDRTPAARNEIAAEVSRYAQTDLVCYLAERPEALRVRQEVSWAPLRQWVGDALGVRLAAVAGVIPVDQPPESVDAVRSHAEGLDDFRLTGLAHAVALLGSAVLGLAVERRRITAADAFEISRIDEAFQAAQWGEDAEALRRTERSRREALALDLWFDALK